MFILDSILDSGLDKVQDWAMGKINDRKARTSINEYLLHEKDRFDHFSDADAFDWAGLAGFIHQELLRKLTAVFLLAHESDRRQMRLDVFHLAHSAACADTLTRQRQVDDIMRNVLIVLGNQLLAQTESLLPYNKVVDEVYKAISAQKEEILAQFDTLNRKLDDIRRELPTFARMISSRQLPPEVRAAFHYRNPAIHFYGRGEEIKFLDGFLDREDPLLFTVITGSAGVGKSKLMYHYAKELEDNPYWKPVYFHQSDTVREAKAAGEWKYPQNLLIIIDYAGDCSSELGQWLISLRDSIARPGKMRFVLLERGRSAQGKGHDGLSAQNPLWYDRLLNGREQDAIKEVQYPDPKKSNIFRELQPLQKSDLWHIMDDYAASIECDLTADQRQDILNFCGNPEKMGSLADQLRPLLVLFVADAWLCNADAWKWDMDEVFQRLIQRYEDHWLYSLCGGNQKAAEALKMLMLYATATRGWIIAESLPTPFDAEYAKIREFYPLKNERQELFRAANEKIEWNGILSPMEPDLAGEYFVLRYLQDMDDCDRLPLTRAFWRTDGNTGFLFRCIDDFVARKMFGDLFAGEMAALVPDDGGDYPEVYAALLVNLSVEQDLLGRAQTAEKLRGLAARFPDNEDIEVQLASGLANLSAEQDLTGRTQTAEELLGLSDRFPGNADIAVRLAMGLVNRSAEQDLPGRAQAVEELRGLAARFPDNADIAVGLAKGLFNLSVGQVLLETAQTAEELRGLAARFPDNADITVRFAKVLANLSAGQDLMGTAHTAEDLRGLATRFPDNEDIAAPLASGLVNLSAEQDLPGRTQTAEELRGLADRFLDNAAIAVELANGLFNLSVKQNLPGRAQTAEELFALATRFLDNEDIAVQLAKGLANLSIKQDLLGMAQTAQELRGLTARFPDNEDIAALLALGLANLSAEQDLPGTAHTAEELRDLAVCFPDNTDIAALLASGLVNLSVEQGLSGRAQTVVELRGLADRFPDNEDIVVELAKGLVSLSLEQDLPGTAQTVEELRALAARFQEVDALLNDIGFPLDE